MLKMKKKPRVKRICSDCSAVFMSFLKVQCDRCYRKEHSKKARAITKGVFKDVGFKNARELFK